MDYSEVGMHGVRLWQVVTVNGSFLEAGAAAASVNMHVNGGGRVNAINRGGSPRTSTSVKCVLTEAAKDKRSASVR